MWGIWPCSSVVEHPPFKRSVVGSNPTRVTFETLCFIFANDNLGPQNQKLFIQWVQFKIYDRLFIKIVENIFKYSSCKPIAIFIIASFWTTPDKIE